MRKVFLFLVMFFIVNSVYSQQLDEWYCNEDTKDAVYEAPNSKFVKKWYDEEDGYNIQFFANGTFKRQTFIYNRNYEIWIDLNAGGKWSRKDKMILVLHYTSITAAADPEMLSKLSARKKAEINKFVNELNAKYKAQAAKGEIDRYNLKRIDNDHLIMGDHRLMSEKLKKELAERKVREEAEKKALEAERQAREAKEAAEREAKEEAEAEYKVFDIVDEMPQFPGGPSAMFQYLSKNNKYSDSYVRGRVLVTCVIEKDGSITDVKVVKSLDSSADREAQRLVKSMPNWIPGKQNGKLRRVKYTIPVTFQ